MANQKDLHGVIEQSIFYGKNKEYGAYKLRKAYNKYLAIAMWIAILIVFLVTAGPTIYKTLTHFESRLMAF